MATPAKAASNSPVAQQPMQQPTPQVTPQPQVNQNQINTPNGIQSLPAVVGKNGERYLTERGKRLTEQGMTINGKFVKITQQKVPKDRTQIEQWRSKVSKYFPAAMYGENRGGNPKITNYNPAHYDSNGKLVPASTDYGLLQINGTYQADRLKKFGYTVQDMFDPEKNLQVAADLWKEQGFEPWYGASYFNGLEY